MKKLLIFCLIFGLTAGAVFAGGESEQTGTSVSKAPVKVVTRFNVPNEEDGVYEYMEDKFGLDLEIVNIPSPNLNEIYDRLNMMIAAGDYPDVMQMRNDDPAAKKLHNNLVEAGKLVNLDAMIDSNPNRWPLLASRLSDKDYGGYVANDGNSYIIPGLLGSWDHSIYLRGDWLEKLDLNIPTTIYELFDVLKAFVENDPDGNRNVGLTMGNAWWFNHFYSAFTGAFDWKLTDGKYVSNYMLPEFKEAVRFLAEMSQAGVLDKEIYTHKAERDELAKFSSGKAGALLIGIGFVGGIEKNLKAYNSDAEIVWCPVDISGPAASARISGPKFFDGFAIYKGTENPEAILDMFEFIMSEDGEFMAINGVEGVHYTMDGDNVVKDIEKLEEEGWGFPGSESQIYQGFRQFTTWTPVMLDSVIDGMTEQGDEYKNFWKTLNAPGVANTNALAGKPINAYAEIGGDCWTVYDSYISGFLYGSKDIETEWDAFISEFLNAGFQKVIDEVNEKYN